MSSYREFRKRQKLRIKARVKWMEIKCMLGFHVPFVFIGEDGEARDAICQNCAKVLKQKAPPK